jgi:hypothetical protein
VSSGEGLDTKAPRRVAGNDVSCMCVRVVSLTKKFRRVITAAATGPFFIHIHTQPPGYNVCMYTYSAFPVCVRDVCKSVPMYAYNIIYIYSVMMQ